MKSKYSIAILSLILVFLPMGCQKSGQWKGQIKEVNGVTIVNNPKRPLYEKPVLVLDEELRIGEQDIPLGQSYRDHLLQYLKRRSQNSEG